MDLGETEGRGKSFDEPRWGKLQWDIHERKRNKKYYFYCRAHTNQDGKKKRKAAFSHTEYAYIHKLFSYFFNKENNKLYF